MLRLGRLVYGRLLFAMQIFVLAVRLCLKRDFRHIAHQSRQSLIATTSLRFARGFCRRSRPAAACSIICHDIARATAFGSRFFCADLIVSIDILEKLSNFVMMDIPIKEVFFAV